MGRTRVCPKLVILLHLALSTSISLLHPCDAKTTSPKFQRLAMIRQMKKLNVVNNFDLSSSSSSSNTEPYGVRSPLTLPPLDALSPIPLPDLNPPYCVFTPYTPTPSTPYVYLPPVIPIQTPPPSAPGSFTTPYPPETVPSSPPTPGTFPSPSTVPGSTPSPSLPSPPTASRPPLYFPSPPIFVPSPPFYVPSPGGGGIVPSPPLASRPPLYFPSPPTFVPSPQIYVPSPGGGGIVPRPPIFHPPIVYPPPTVPPPPQITPSIALWCVAKPSVPDPIIQEAMNYACGSGADCLSIQPEGSCFQPDTLFAHASYAFNSYWQRTKVAGGTCSFGGTAILVTVDPSYDGCHFVYY